MYYLTVDYLIPIQIESNLPDAKKRFRETFGRSSLYFEYFEYFEIPKNQNIQNIFVLANFSKYSNFFEIF